MILITFLFTCLFQVFDDGDERTLRRTSLCLKGERHFNESEVGVCKEILFSCWFAWRWMNGQLITKSWQGFLLLFLQTLDHLPLTDPENFGTPVVQVARDLVFPPKILKPILSSLEKFFKSLECLERYLANVSLRKSIVTIYICLVLW